MKSLHPHSGAARVLCCLAVVVCAAGAFAAPPVFTGKLDAPSFEQHKAAYPEGGVAYCVPVSAADGVAWLGEHGYDRLPARDAEEDIVTALAAKMQTDPLRGTAWFAAETGLADYLDDYYDPSRVRVHVPDGMPPDPQAFDWVQQQVCRADTAAIIMRTTYLNLPGFGWGQYVQHGMFLAGYDSAAGSMWLHDPLLGEVAAPEPVALVENLDVRGRFEYYSFDLALSPPAASPTGTEIEARWDNILIFSVAGDGDANHDGLVDSLDLGALANNYRLSDVGWAGGDFNLDGVVDVMDLAVLATHYSPAGPRGQPVPAPAAVFVLLAGAAVLRRRRR